MLYTMLLLKCQPSRDGLSYQDFPKRRRKSTNMHYREYHISKTVNRTNILIKDSRVSKGFFCNTWPFNPFRDITIYILTYLVKKVNKFYNEGAHVYGFCFYFSTTRWSSFIPNSPKSGQLILTCLFQLNSTLMYIFFVTLFRTFALYYQLSNLVNLIQSNSR